MRGQPLHGQDIRRRGARTGDTEPRALLVPPDSQASCRGAGAWLLCLLCGRLHLGVLLPSQAHDPPSPDSNTHFPLSRTPGHHPGTSGAKPRLLSLHTLLWQPRPSFQPATRSGQNPEPKGSCARTCHSAFKVSSLRHHPPPQTAPRPHSPSQGAGKRTRSPR